MDHQMILPTLISINPGVYLFIQPVRGNGRSIDADIDSKSILLALQPHKQEANEYDGSKHQNQNKFISILP